MSRVRVGVIGCGGIAQVQHLPHLRELEDRFEIAAVCDVSPQLVEFIGDMYGVPARFTDYRALVEHDLDGVLLCHSDPKTDAVVEALEAGKHVFIEKPMCYSTEEGDAIVEAARKAGKVAMVAYMKQHDPGYRYVKGQLKEVPDIRFIQVNHLHPDNRLHLEEFTLYRFDDVPSSVREENRVRREAAIKAAVGDVPSHVRAAFGTLAGSMIHDISSLRGLFGSPSQVVSVEIWREGRCISMVLAYERDKRCVATWADLPELWDFRETLEVYGSARRVSIQFPTGFARGLPSPVTVQGSDEGGIPWKKEVVVNYQNAFKLELIHFHECIVEGKTPITDVEGARADAALMRDIVLAYLHQQR